MNILRSISLLLFFPAILIADGFIIFPPPEVTPLSVKYHRVNCTIDNGVATTTVDQVFVNTNEYDVTGGRYVFPVPAGASIDQFRVIVDGVEKTATVMSKEEARELFSTAVKNSNQASLLEYIDNGAYSLEIGTMGPGASRQLQLSYVEVLPKSDGLSRYLYPLNTEKYSMKLIDTVSITVAISNSTPITSVYSPSFPVTLERTDETHVTATYTSARTRPDRDFDLYCKLSDDDISFHLFTFKKTDEDGYFLMLITPQLVEPAEGEVVAKDIVFTIDKSGSMGGTKIQQAREALRFCINRLLPEDFFNIVAFESTVGSNAGELLPATADNVGAVREFVDGITADGGTNISEALITSLSRMQQGARPHYCIFLTDGQATAGVRDIGQISQLVNEANTTGTRIFSVGFGFDVNTILIDKISTDNGGFPLYCNPDQNIEEVIGDLYKKIESPVLTSPVLAFDGAVELYGIHPEKLPDLFSGSEIAVFGRYKGEGNSLVTLSGNSHEEAVELNFPAAFPAESDVYPFVPRLWATRKIAALMTKIKLQTLTQENIEPLIDSVELLSRAYGIVTPYTSSIFVGGDIRAMTGGLQEASGGSANDASNFMQGMQQNTNAAQTMVTDTAALSYNVAPQLNQMQNIGSKLFVYSSDSVWRDVSFDSAGVTDTVYYGTDAYFELAARNKELRGMLTVGNQAAFSYSGKNYLVLDNGSSRVIPEKSRVIPRMSKERFSVVQRNGMIRFRRTSGMSEGSVAIYTIAGRYMAARKFSAGAKELIYIGESRGGAPLSSGAYLAVYRSSGTREVRKFSVW